MTLFTLLQRPCPIEEVIKFLFILLTAHALCDFPWQGDYMSMGKNRLKPLPGTPWYWCLGWHAMIHAGAVYLITGSLALGIFELIVHFGIDDMKCDGLLSYDQDQFLHIGCKVFAALLAVVAGSHSLIFPNL